MRYTATADLNLDALFSPNKMGMFQRALTERYYQYCNEIVPKRTGVLRASGAPCYPDDQSITWHAEYAYYVYNMDGDVNWTTQGTTSQWGEHAKAEHMGDLTDYVALMFRSRL